MFLFCDLMTGSQGLLRWNCATHFRHKVAQECTPTSCYKQNKHALCGTYFSENMQHLCVHGTALQAESNKSDSVTSSEGKIKFGLIGWALVKGSCKTAARSLKVKKTWNRVIKAVLSLVLTGENNLKRTWMMMPWRLYSSWRPREKKSTKACTWKDETFPRQSVGRTPFSFQRDRLRATDRSTQRSPLWRSRRWAEGGGTCRWRRRCSGPRLWTWDTQPGRFRTMALLCCPTCDSSSITESWMPTHLI